MTYQHIKDMAEKGCYQARDWRTNIGLRPCKCGNTRPTIWYGNASGYFVQCDRCHIGANSAKTKIEAKVNWNNMMIKEADQNG